MTTGKVISTVDHKEPIGVIEYTYRQFFIKRTVVFYQLRWLKHKYLIVKEVKSFLGSKFYQRMCYGGWHQPLDGKGYEIQDIYKGGGTSTHPKSFEKEIGELVEYKCLDDRYWKQIETLQDFEYPVVYE